MCIISHQSLLLCLSHQNLEFSVMRWQAYHFFCQHSGKQCEETATQLLFRTILWSYHLQRYLQAADELGSHSWRQDNHLQIAIISMAASLSFNLESWIVIKPSRARALSHCVKISICIISCHKSSDNSAFFICRCCQRMCNGITTR